MIHSDNQGAPQINQIFEEVDRAARAGLEAKLDELYTETEKNYPPNTFNFAEQAWNDGFYRGQLKALELVSMRVFGKHGDQLSNPVKRSSDGKK